MAVHYVVTDNALAVLFVTPDGEFGTLVDVSRAELNQRIAELRNAIRDRGNVLPAAQALHRWLIAPIEPQLQRTGATTLVLSLTGSLRYLPFAALHDGERYLVERIPLVVWAQAGQAGGAPKRDDWQVAAMGASRGGAGFTALPGVPLELDSIVRDASGAKGVLPGRILLDQAFDREALYDALARYNVAHIASHFEFRPGDESRSVLLLGDGQTMSLGQLAVLPFRNVQLLALSACNTATGGGVNEHGLEVEGLAAVVQRRGARSVLASLWAVSDASTGRLMTGFYRDHPQGLARALQQAQLAMLRGAAPAGTPAPSPTQTAACAGPPVRRRLRPAAGLIPTTGPRSCSPGSGAKAQGESVRSRSFDPAAGGADAAHWGLCSAHVLRTRCAGPSPFTSLHATPSAPLRHHRGVPAAAVRVTFRVSGRARVSVDRRAAALHHAFVLRQLGFHEGAELLRRGRRSARPSAWPGVPSDSGEASASTKALFSLLVTSAGSFAGPNRPNQVWMSKPASAPPLSAIVGSSGTRR